MSQMKTLSSQSILPAALVLACVGFTSSANAQINIVLDYSLDTTGFFSGENEYRRATLESARDYVAAAIANTQVAAITPSGSNSWTPSVAKPDFSSYHTIDNPTVPAQTFYIYVGAYNAGGTPNNDNTHVGTTWVDPTLSRPIDPAWQEAIDYRGGSTFKNTYSTITFNSYDPSYYYFGDNPSEGYAGMYDFWTLSAREILRGIGAGPGLQLLSLNDQEDLVYNYTGPELLSLYPDGVRLTAAYDGYLQRGLLSIVAGGAYGVDEQLALFSYGLNPNERRLLTEADLAFLRDVGFDTSAATSSIPEPSSYAALAGIAGLVAIVVRRKRGQ